MTSFARLQQEDRRLVILRLLSEDTDYSLNDSLISGGLDAMGHGCSRDVVRGDLAWLAEQGLLRIEDVMSGRVLVATLGDRGLDVAQGRAVVPGVRRPRPGE